MDKLGLATLGFRVYQGSGFGVRGVKGFIRAYEGLGFGVWGLN